MEDEDSFDDVPDFTEVELIRTAIGSAMSLLRQAKRGQLVLWAVIEHESMISRESQHWPQFWRRLQRDFRRETGIVMWAKRGTGVKLLTIDEQITWRSRKRHRKAARQLFKDIVELEAMPVEQLTERQQHERSMRVRIAKQQRKEVLLSCRIDDAINRGAATDPSRVRYRTVSG